MNSAVGTIDVDKTLQEVERIKDKSLRLPQPVGYWICYGSWPRCLRG